MIEFIHLYYFQILGFMLFVGLFMHSKILKNLKTHHAEILGKPTLFLNNSPKNGWATQCFIWSGRHVELNDPSLSKLILFQRVWETLYIAVFILLFAGLTNAA